MNIEDAIKTLEEYVDDPSKGLPEEIFEYVSRMTPLVNVDLLVKDENGRTLLSWRDDQYAGTGWHIPGGIIRHKEKMETRIQKVAESEIRARVEFDPVPISVEQLINKNITRGHFISLLFRCSLSGKFAPDNKGLSGKDRGYVKWHDSCPADLIKCHEVYRKFI